MKTQENSNYIVCYTLKHNDIADTFVDRCIYFSHEEGLSLTDAEKLYNELIEQDGNESDYFLWTIAITKVIKSSNY